MKSEDRYVDEEATTIVFVRPRAIPATSARQPEKDQLWDANDVARYLKVSRSWVYHRAEAGLLPLRRVGGLLRFDPAEVKAFAAGERVDHLDGGAGRRRAERPARRPTRR